MYVAMKLLMMTELKLFQLLHDYFQLLVSPNSDLREVEDGDISAPNRNFAISVGFNFVSRNSRDLCAVKYHSTL